MPRLDDPSEYAIVKKMYFNNDDYANESIDPIERLERMDSKLRNNKSHR